MEAIMRNLKMIIGACLLISTAGCAYYDHGYAYSDGYSYGSDRSYYSRPVYYGYEYRPYAYRYHDYGFWEDHRPDAHG
jgi:hypothetical protein